MSAPSSGRKRAGRKPGNGAPLAATAAILALYCPVPGNAQGDDCLSSECFFSERIRTFQIVDSDTLVVYAGRDRCAFVVDVSGLFCDLTYLPEVEFFRTRDRILENNTGLRRGGGGFGRNERICPNNASMYSLETFGFSSLDEDETPRGRPACEVRGVAPASDNDLIELLTIEGIAPPPPPVGNGDISRTRQEPAGAPPAQQ